MTGEELPGIGAMVETFDKGGSLGILQDPYDRATRPHVRSLDPGSYNLRPSPYRPSSALP